MRNTPELQEITDRIGSQVRVERLSRGWSQKQLSDKIGVTHQQLYKYERGDNRISAARLEIIARAFKMPTSDFFTKDVDCIPDEGQRLNIELIRVFVKLPIMARVAFVNCIRGLA